eukprot:TRINITY_DN7109_c0_g1_i3.p1 TRINITY_DN7109_c0_g1~~TRINITY_DN7109_c0_g1_i3.p1  ORF type:complete len:256 (+),score=30.02 TRINITY_DN7109_c0_g1_i3:48-770(+)
MSKRTSTVKTASSKRAKHNPAADVISTSDKVTPKSGRNRDRMPTTDTTTGIHDVTDTAVTESVVVVSQKVVKRCAWPGIDDPVYTAYHDKEWGVPIRDDDRALFEFLILEGAQAGLSWITILKKREGYRKAFDNFDVQKVAAYDTKKVDSLLQNPGIIRNKLKIAAAITNAKVVLQIQKEKGSFSNYIWAYVNNKPIIGNTQGGVTSPEAEAMSADLKQRGCKFVGPVVIFSFMVCYIAI